MRQTLGWLSILLLFGGSAARWYLQRGNAQTARPDAAQWSYAQHNLGQAAGKLEEMGGIMGSYDGIPSDLVHGMTVVAAGQNYCVELVREGWWYRNAGPGGEPEPGRCVA